jgi:hypothetical protein
MGFFDKLQFWKKKDPFDYSKLEGGGDLGLGKDTTPGLGGTPDLGAMPGSSATGTYHEPGVTIQGSGYENLKPTELDEPHQGYARPQASQVAPQQGNKDLEIVSAKLDSIKAAIESLNLRIQNMEEEMKRMQRKGW